VTRKKLTKEEEEACCIVIIIAVIIYAFWWITVITYGLIWVAVAVVIILYFYFKSDSYKNRKRIAVSKKSDFNYRKEKIRRLEQDRLNRIKQDNFRVMQKTQQKLRTFRRSRYIPKHIRDIVWEKDKGKCADCGSDIDIEFDHIIPFSKGGSNTVNNIQILCKKCNRTKYNNIGFKEIFCPECKKTNVETSGEKISVCSYCGANLRGKN